MLFRSPRASVARRRHVEGKGGAMADAPRRVALPSPDVTSSSDAPDASAPPEALRAIAALLGRAATPTGSKPKPSRTAAGNAPQRKRHATPPRPRPGSPRRNAPRHPDPATQLVPPAVAMNQSVAIGDREVLIQGVGSNVGEAARVEVRRAQRRMKRARRAVRAALERLIAAAPEELAG